MRVFNGNIIGKNKNFFVFLSSWQVCVPIFLLVLAFGIFLTGCNNENEQIDNLSINKVQVGDVFVEKSPLLLLPGNGGSCNWSLSE